MSRSPLNPLLHSENTDGALVVETVLVETQYVVSASKMRTVAFINGSLVCLTNRTPKIPSA